MKLAVVSINDPNGIGGVESTIKRLSEYAKKDFDVEVFYPEVGFEKLKDFDAVHFHTSPFYMKKWQKQWKELKREHNNIICTYYIYSEANAIRRLAKSVILKQFINKMIVHSQRLKEHYKMLGPKFLFPPVSQEFFNIFKERNPLHPSYLGREDEDKGISKVDKIDGIKIGGNPIDILKETSVLVLPYTHLGKTVDIPLLVLEAMAAGVPVLASKVGELQEILPPECLFEKDSEIEEKIKYLERNFDFIGKALHEKAKEICHIEVVGREYVNFLRK